MSVGSEARRTSAASWGLAAALALMAVAMALPAATGWNVRIRWFPPLHAEWEPRLGPGSPIALALAVAASVLAVRWAERLTWPRLVAATFGVGLAWMLSLAHVDGWAGVGDVLEHPYEYLRTAREVTDVRAMLEEFVSRIGYAAEPDNWPVHVAGHPPGALLFFVVLVEVGLGGGYAAGLVVTVLAATTPVAVLLTLSELGAREPARRAAPFLALGPAAVWQSVSADALFAAWGCWGIYALTRAAVRRNAAWAVLAGLLLGYLVMMSYGLPLYGVLALAVLFLAGSWRSLPVAAAAALCVVLGFAWAGFVYWEGLPELHQRYWDGVASRRPAAYWVWGNLAALMFSAGPLAGAALAHLGTVLRRPAGAARPLRPRAGWAAMPRPVRVVWTLCASGWVMVLLANASQMSKAEVERIWLPFVPWLLVGCALLPERWRRGGLVLQLAVALAVQHLLRTSW
jgi:hypothetical protein